MPVHQWLAQWSSWGWPLLANHLWLATLLSLVALGAVAFLARAPGRARYAVLLIASAKFALPSAMFASVASQFGVDFSSLFASRAPAETPAFVYQLTAPVVQVEGSISSGMQSASGHNELFCALSIIWLIVFAVLLAIWWRDRRRFRFAMRRGSVIGATRERRALDRAESWLGIKRDIPLLLLPDTIEPGVWGVWRPLSFCPKAWLNSLTMPSSKR
jgi:bla regulator protein BlaR1